MAEDGEEIKRAVNLHRFTAALESGALTNVRVMLNSLHPAEIASLLESVPPDQRELAWELVSSEHEGEVLLHLNEKVRRTLIRDMEPHELVAATEGLDTDDLADLVQDLPKAVMQQLLHSMGEQNRDRLRAVMSYPEDTAGGLMNTDTLTVRADVTLDVVLRYLRWHGKIPDMTDSLIVVRRDDIYLGLLSISALLTRDPGLLVSEVMDKDIEAIPAMMHATEVASLFENRDLISAPVIDSSGKLLGRITIDDVVDVIREEAENSLLRMAGLHQDEDMFAPVAVSARRRALWLGINLATAVLASWVIGLFEATIQKVVALAVLMPIVASMGGIAGTQTLTMVIRGIAMGQISGANARRLLHKELAVAVLNGALWGVVVSAIAIAMFGNYHIAWIIAVAMVANLLVAAMTGVLLPLLLRNMGMDPALSGSVVLTTFTDVVGFMVFLGVATLVFM